MDEFDDITEHLRDVERRAAEFLRAASQEGVDLPPGVAQALTALADTLHRTIEMVGKVNEMVGKVNRHVVVTRNVAFADEKILMALIRAVPLDHSRPDAIAALKAAIDERQAYQPQRGIDY